MVDEAETIQRLLPKENEREWERVGESGRERERKLEWN